MTNPTRDDLLLEISRHNGNGEMEVSSISKSALKKLAAECMIEIESRRCTTWKFGAPYPSIWLSTTAQQTADNIAEYKRQCAAYADDQVHKNARKWKDRTEIWARITPKGYGYLQSLGLL